MTTREIEMEKLTYQQQVIREEWERAEEVYDANFDSHRNRTGSITFFEIEEMAEQFFKRVTSYVDPDKKMTRDQYRQFRDTRQKYFRMLVDTGYDLTAGLSFIPSKSDQQIRAIFTACGITPAPNAEQFVMNRVNWLLHHEKMNSFSVADTQYDQLLVRLA